jgi:plastocyanin
MTRIRRKSQGSSQGSSHGSSQGRAQALRATAVSLPLLLATSCGTELGVVEPASSVSCPGAAQILFADGLMHAACGCAESSSAAVETNLTCTVPAGTLVEFRFTGTSLKHQILSQGSPSFASGPVIDPLTVLRSFAVPFQASGTYRFTDPFHPRINGQIVVP